MKILGIEFAADEMRYVLLDGSDEECTVLQKNRLTLSGTRSRDALVAFQQAVLTVYNATSPDLIGIKAKPESGRLQAGAAALKMEGIAVANAPCNVCFISGAKVNQCNSTTKDVPKYLEPAFKTARVAMSAQND